jgi:hypothetical protein
MAIITNPAIRAITPVENLSRSELGQLWRIYRILDQARSDFLNQLLTVDEYLDLLFSSGVNVDQYLHIVHQNLTNHGITT